MKRKLRIGIVGCGSIGGEISRYITEELYGRARLVGICDKVFGRAQALRKSLKRRVQIFSKEELIAHCDLVIEAASVTCARDIIVLAENKRVAVMILSVGAFVKYPQLIEKVTFCDKVYIPSGAVSGIDGITALAMDTIRKVTLITSKPPSSLQGVAFLEAQGIDVSAITQETIVFKGSLQDAVTRFPRNINVAATIYLASRCEEMTVIVKVNPLLARNTHRIEVEAEQGKMCIEVENQSSKTNPRTSALTILSIKSLLKKLIENIKVGT